MKGLTIRRGSVRVRIFASKSGPYVRHEVRWTDHHGRRRRLKRSKLSEAKKEAERLADDLARGHHHSELTLADLASFRAGIVNLFGTGKTLELATAEYADMHRLLVSSLSASRGEGRGEVPTPKQLAAHWLATHQQAQAYTATTSATVETFLLELRARGMSARHQEDLRDRLRKWATENPGAIAQQTAPTVQAWVLGLDIGPRTRNNYLAAIKTLFADAALTNHPHAAAIQLIKPSKLGRVRKAIWKPEEMRRLLDTAKKTDRALIPVLVLGAFGKLRASEAAAVSAADLRLSDRQLILQDGGKTDGRLIPLPENCFQWLEKYAPKAGPMWSLSIDAMNAHCRRLAARCELKWRPNALRKSAQLYATLLDPNYDRIAAQAGTSAKMMRKHYVDPHLATKSDAIEWFAIGPVSRRVRGKTSPQNVPTKATTPKNADN